MLTKDEFKSLVLLLGGNPGGPYDVSPEDRAQAIAEFSVEEAATQTDETADDIADDSL